MSIHDEIQQLIPAYALDILSTDERARVQAHLETCEICRRSLSEYAAVTADLALAVPIVTPPHNLKLRTMERALHNTPYAPDHPRKAQSSPWLRSRLSATGLAAAALAVACVVLLWSVWQTYELNQQLAIQRDFTTMLAYAQGTALSVHGTQVAPQADGRLYLDPDANVAALVTVELPPLDRGQAYQVWLTEPNGRQVSGGTFTVDTTGNGWLLIRAPQHLDQYTTVQVTTEPLGGSSTPTTRPVLAAPLAAH